MKLIYRTLVCCLFLLTCFSATSQNNSTGSWNILSFKLNVDKKLSAFAETQLRSQLFYNNFSYYEAKTGASINFKKNFSALIGGGRYVTYSNDDNFKKPFVNKEWRIWEQFGMNSYLDRVKFEHRYRIEQRWTSNTGYRNRFRYKLGATAPLNNKKIDPGTFFLSASDELFFNNKAPNFEQNRLYAGAGYEVSKHLTVQSGYLYQTSYALTGTHANKGYFQISLMFEATTHKDHQEKTHGSMD